MRLPKKKLRGVMGVAYRTVGRKKNYAGETRLIFHKTAKQFLCCGCEERFIKVSAGSVYVQMVQLTNTRESMNVNIFISNSSNKND